VQGMLSRLSPSLPVQSDALPDAQKTKQHAKHHPDHTALPSHCRQDSLDAPQASDNAEESLLPPDRRRPLAARVDDIVADPRAGKCSDSCWICERVPDATADAALSTWDALARAGTWPITTLQVLTILRENGLPDVTHKPVRRVLSHRRWLVLSQHIRQDIEKWQRERLIEL
jgi:hypothetical protein